MYYKNVPYIWLKGGEEEVSRLIKEFDLVRVAEPIGDCWLYYNADQYDNCTNIFDCAVFIRRSFWADGSLEINEGAVGFFRMLAAHET